MFLLFTHQLHDTPPPTTEEDVVADEDLFAALDQDGEDTGDSDVLPVEHSPKSGLTDTHLLLPPEVIRTPYMLPFAPQLDVQPRPYQTDALRAWLGVGGRGIVVLPTGAGKTIVAYSAIAQLGVRTLVVVPTIELLRQWRSGAVRHLGAPEAAVGAIGGGEHQSGPITIITYDSAAMPRRRLAGYGLLVFDEAHHLPA